VNDLEYGTRLNAIRTAGQEAVSSRPTLISSIKTSCAVGASPSMKMWFRAASRDGSVYGTRIVGRRLLGGRNSPCDDTDPAIKTDPRR
jgi:hypothetical protein